jgi:hypothetical protein
MAKKNILPASSYAKPHTMSGKTVEAKLKKMADPNKMPVDKLGPNTAVQRVSAGDPGREDVKTDRHQDPWHWRSYQGRDG